MPSKDVLPEMAAVVERYELGVLVPRATPESIAAVVNELDAARIDAFKRHSLRAAKQLSWEVESREFVQACLDAAHEDIESRNS